SGAPRDAPMPEVRCPRLPSHLAGDDTGRLRGDTVLQSIKRLLPSWSLRPWRAYQRRRQQRQELAALPLEGRRLYHVSQLADYRHVRLDPEDEADRLAVESAAHSVYGDAWDYYSGALRREVVEGFVRTLGAVAGQIDYLEIGSCQGLSMSLMGLLLRRRNCL